MKIVPSQMPQYCIDIIQAEMEVFSGNTTIEVVNAVPDTDQVPLLDRLHWLRVPDVVCVFVDMKGSTQLSASAHDRATAGAYQLFTGGAVRLLHAFAPAYIDVRGDGAFALFNRGQEHRALAAAVTFKTFAHQVAAPKIRDSTGVEVGCHIGIDQKTVLVRRIGLRRVDGRTDRQNEVWAGKPVNMASKLASLGDSNELLASDRFIERISSQYARKSCGCPSGDVRDLWTARDVREDPRFDFDTAYVLRSIWCKEHGRAYAEEMLSADASR